ncbi:hypothetical protein EDC04DRAFT_13020 [Pisolithus marmoratus]|nr:hypothetical protein EDC04DRAFT_13020 [Pisolithus marmoratus]
MLHHAAHLLSASSVTSLSSILQVAAGRAWTRRAHIRSAARKRVDTSGVYHHSLLSSSRCLHKPEVTKPPLMQGPVGVRSVDPDTLSECDTNWTDPGKADSMDYLDPPVESTPLVTVTSACREDVLVPQFPAPASQKAFYKDLLRVASSSSHSMKTAINYHFNCPKAFRSARSYNFLINLAIRHAAFGTAMRLLLSMREELIRPNMETWKLIVRWLVRTGRWDEARARVSRITRRLLGRQPETGNEMRPHTIPLPLWLELFGSQKHGALRYYHRHRSSAAARHEKCSPQESSGTSLRPCPSPVAPKFRYQVLMKALPLLTSDIHPRVILTLSRTMIETGHRELAFSMISSYLRNLPSRIRPCHRRTILNIIHLHMCTLPIKQGLSRHFAQRRILFDFLDACPSIKPSSMSLFLLLGSLRGSRRSGTLALQCLRKFRGQWGPHIESGMVRRRVVSLALKEGRLDIAEDILRREKMACRIKRGWRLQIEVWGDPSTRASFKAQRRQPLRSYFGRKGVENRRWSLLEKKILRMKERKCKKKLLSL